jgi:hypothetical protein
VNSLCVRAAAARGQSVPAVLGGRFCAYSALAGQPPVHRQMSAAAEPQD